MSVRVEGGCRECRPRLALFVGGDLDAITAAGVAAHLRGCLPCRREASGLQQAGKALGAAAEAVTAAGVAGVDEAMFTSMHADIMAATASLPPAAARWSSRFGWVAAAVVLFACGWWLVRSSEPESLLERRPLATAGEVSEPLAQPWAGPRARLQPVGFDEPGADAADGRHDLRVGTGMMGRLRTLEDEPPPRVPR